MSYQPPYPPVPVQQINYQPQGPGPNDVDHLRLLAIFHYIVGGLISLISLVPLIYVLIGVFIMVAGQAASNSGSSSSSSSNGPPAGAFAAMGCLFSSIGIIGFLILATIGGMNLYSARSMQLQRRRTLSLIVAGIDCLWVPFGTILGIFTFIVLLRSSVEELYRRQSY